MIKVVIFDADGMVIRAEMFSNILSKTYNIPLQEILPFFENEFQLCLVGKSDIKVELKKYMKKWKITKSIDKLLEDWFKFEDKVDKRLLRVIIKLQTNGIKCVLATNQEKSRTRYLLDKMNFDNVFDEVYSSAEIGFRKPTQEFYHYIYKELKKQIKNLKKEEIVIWDDREKNITAARSYGFKAKVYAKFNDFTRYLVDVGLLCK